MLGPRVLSVGEEIFRNWVRARSPIRRGLRPEVPGRVLFAQVMLVEVETSGVHVASSLD